MKRAKEDASAKIAEMKEVGGNIKALDTEIAEVDEKLKQIATTLPNLPMILCQLEQMKRTM